MGYPTLYEPSLSRKVITTFGGLNKAPRIGDSEWSAMENMTADLYPIMATRPCRSKVGSNVQAMISKDALCTVEGGRFYINGHETDLTLTAGEKQLVGMGAYVVILPDRKYINTVKPEDYGSIDASYESAEPIVAELCDLEGNVYSSVESGADAPEDLGKTWVDTSTEPPTVRQYAKTYDTWSAIPSVYVRLSCTGIGNKFNQYDGVTLSGFQDIHLTGLNTSAVIWNKGDDYIVVVGVIEGRVVEEATIKVERTMPQMDFVVEYQNRLWGCYYGLDAAGNPLNEIYASAQGDFKNWSRFMGIESDSYRVSCGTDGSFTGAAVVQNQPVFFKEECMHAVHGTSMPFQVQAVQCRGVQQGCHKSLALVDEVLYYKGREGICAYGGSLPSLVSSPLGDTPYRNAVGGATGGKYYVSMERDEGWELFVLDTRRGLWHREDDLRAAQFCESGGRLYCALPDGTMLVMNGTPGAWESDVPFVIESGILGLDEPAQKYLHSLILRLKLEGSMTVEVRCDDGPWEEAYSLNPKGLRSYELAIHPKRCDHFAYRLSGRGSLRLYSITKYWEAGSERP